MVLVQKIISGKNFIPYCNLIKVSVAEKRTYVNKGRNLLNTYILKVLLSIPFNKLPWVESTKVTTGLNCKNLSQYQKVFHFKNVKFRTTLPHIS